ncbi:MAG TPA: glucose 1-dehydrogenase [Pyrinomonadaceae bacterium]|nr:glucose 1-dehydrogenase [Pyrinomonadaceae bacterium]
MFKLNEKIALVTGAASGIGEAAARAMAGAGAKVYVADIDVERGKAVADDIGPRAEFIELNVADRNACRAAADQVGRLDILVNNAGIGHVGTILETAAEDLDRLFAVNVRGMFHLTKAFVAGMIDRKYGVIINLASIGGVVAIRDRIAYCTTKFAVVGFTKCLALDHALQGIRANCVCPGRVETDFVKKRISEYPDPEKAYRDMAASQAVGRMATPDEIAACILYLASDEASFITGTALEIDGGFSIGK